MSTDTTTTTTTTTNDRPEYTMNRVELTEEAYDFGNYPPMYINGRPVGPNAPTYFIAELSCNHGQDYKVAEQLVQAAYEAGADAVKLQTLSPETITIDCDNEYFQVKNTELWDGVTLYELYQTAYTPWEWVGPLKELCNSLGMDLFSSPFSIEAVDFLDSLDVPCFKIASFEGQDQQLLKRVARTGKPVIMSTGMASVGDIDESVRTLRDAGNTQLCVLKCTSAYPAKPEDAHLATMNTIANTFGTTPGLSDHTLGIAVPVAAVTMGARIVEKHFTLDRSVPGPDSTFSLEPQEFKDMVETCRIAEKAIGRINFGGSGKKENSNKNFRRSLFIVENVKKGEVFTRENVKSIRPSFGLHTRFFPDILGKVASCDIERGTPAAWTLIDSDDSFRHREAGDDDQEAVKGLLGEFSAEENQQVFVGEENGSVIGAAVVTHESDALATVAFTFDQQHQEADNVAKRFVMSVTNDVDKPINMTVSGDADKALAAAIGMSVHPDDETVYRRRY
eukprot:TRINITY_DN10149_c0_g1_i1.p1 TRINITY_DN10149_c0_g1~~TRINITY_DN10149_c0_g1_i1.p1  ORF type:complete len:530 (+),score=184.49 TRINITY_DN10149_c0_g1_i1:73-1590(+)